MASFIESLFLKKHDGFRNYEIQYPDLPLQGFADVNFFIGPNNSGKSRFLRALSALGDFQYKPGEFSLEDLSKSSQDFRASLEKSLRDLQHSAISMGSIFPRELSRFDHIEALRSDGNDPLKFLIDLVENFAKNQSTEVRYANGNSQSSDSWRYVNAELVRMSTDYLKEVRRIDSLRAPKFRAIYIPILRGLRPFGGLVGKDPYRERTMSDYSLKVNETLEIFTGQLLAKVLESHLLGRKEQREKVQRYQDFLSTEFFGGKVVELVPLQGHDTVSVHVEGESERFIYELGDGMQSVIALTFLPFMEAESAWFLIEEPENYLHPGLQRRLVEQFLSHPVLSRHQYFMTTHSNHLIDVSSEMARSSIFLFRKSEAVDQFRIIPVKAQEKNVLEEIGARASSVFLTNTTVWVEGVTDRKYLRSFLLRLKKELVGSNKDLREDSQYSIAELGGSNLVHFSFSEIDDESLGKIKVSKICSNSFVMVDGDNKNKAQRVETLKKELGESFYVFDVKEIENSLPEIVVRETVGIIFSKSLIHKNLVSTVSRIQAVDYRKEGTGLGEYLDSIFSIDFFKTKTGTLRDKTKFCDLATSWMESNLEKWSLDGEADIVARKILDFIAANNK
jgi:hypothetical protein